MMKFRVGATAIVFLAASLFGSSGTNAWMAQRGAAVYSGPGDIITFTAWYSCGRAYSAAIAVAGTQALCRIRNPTSGELCDILVATNGGQGLTSNCSGAGAGQSVSSFCGGVDCKVHTKYDQRSSNACAGSTTCNIVQATSGNQPALLAADSYTSVVSTGSTSIVMQSATNYTPNGAAKMTIMGVGNVSNVAAANIMAVSLDLINRNSASAGNWVLAGTGANKLISGLTEGAWHTAVGVLNGAAIGTGICANTSGCTFASSAPSVSTTAGKIQTMGIVNAATVNKWREGGFADNYTVSAADAGSLNSNSSTYWGFTPP